MAVSLMPLVDQMDDWLNKGQHELFYGKIYIASPFGLA